MKTLSIVSFVSMSLFAVACAAPVDAVDGDETASTSEALSTYGQAVVGTYHRTSGNALSTDFTLRANSTYTIAQQVFCVRAPCPPVVLEDGTFTASGFGRSGTLTLRSTTGAKKTVSASLSASRDVLTINGSTKFARVPEQICGGFAGFQCPTGLECVFTGPSYPDQAGTCKAPGEGAACGGIAGIACEPGLRCIITETGHSDPMGVCVR